MYHHKYFSSPIERAKQKSSKKEASSTTSNSLDFEQVNQAALPYALQVCEELLPEGKQEGKEYVALNPKRNDCELGSFKIHLESGMWSDFALDDAKGGDLISLVAYLDGSSQVAAARKLEALIKTIDTPKESKPKPSLVQAWTPTFPELAQIPAPPAHPTLGIPTTGWNYLDRHGRIACIVNRFDSAGGKEFRPLTYCQNATGKKAWRWQGCSEPRPLYRLPEILANPDAPILVCEGEKAADAAQKLFPAWITITSMHGAQSPEKTDWSPLKGREVFIWPDNDEAGSQYAKGVIELVRETAPSTPIAVMQPVTFFPGLDDLGKATLRPGFTPPSGWDAADALALGWTADHIRLLPETMFVPIPVSGPVVRFGSYLVNDKGVHITKTDKKGEPFDVRIASRIDVVALTRNDQKEKWGLLLRFKDRDGHVHEWAMPHELLSSGGDIYRQQLLSLGAEISSSKNAKDDLTGYFMAANPPERALCVEHTGWLGSVFVLPHRTFGQNSERVIFQATEAYRTMLMSVSGTLDEWKQNVAAKCIGNSRLVLTVCVALSGPFLKPLEHENGGLHLRGPSSSGKTKALTVAASVWGGKAMVRTWRTTGNAIESLAAQHNECVLILDELGQVAPDEAGNIAYTLGNGQSKARANRFGNARPCTNWRLLFLSTGEIGLADHVAQVGGRIKAGQEVRLLDIPSDGGCGLGLFENLHGVASPQEFADSLQTLSERYYGSAAEALLTRLTSGPDELNNAIVYVGKCQRKFVENFVDRNAHGQVYRAAGRFGLIAGVGEYCIEIGVLPWPAGESIQGMRKCFLAWIETRGGNQAAEEVRALAQVRRFLELHGESRFTPVGRNGIEETSSLRTINRAGFRNVLEGGSVEYWVLPEAYKSDLCAGFDPRIVTRALVDGGFLQPGSDGKATVTKRLPGIEVPSRVYVVKPSIFECGERAAA